MNILEEFDKDNLPKTTNILCFHCCHSFSTQPLPMPFLYKNNIFYVKYNFCSWECMKTFNNESNNTNSFQIFTLITLFQKHVFDCNIKAFAPSKYTLKCFGGDLSIEDFRRKTITNYKILDYPFITCNPKIEQTDNFSWIKKSSAAKKYNDFDRSTATEATTIKLKRQKEQKNTNTLESVMGLMRMNDSKP